MKITLEVDPGRSVTVESEDGVTLNDALELFQNALLGAGFIFDPTYETLDLIDTREESIGSGDPYTYTQIPEQRTPRHCSGCSCEDPAPEYSSELDYIEQAEQKRWLAQPTDSKQEGRKPLPRRIPLAQI